MAKRIEWQKAVLSSSDLKELWLGLAPGWRFYLYRREKTWTGEAWRLDYDGSVCHFKENGPKPELEAKLEAQLGIESEL